MKPLTKNQLVKRLLATPRGQIFLWNLLDSHDEKLFDLADLPEFFRWWCMALPAVDAKAPLPDGSDPLFVTLDLLRLEPNQWSSLTPAYPGLAALGPKPEFRVLCCRATSRRVHEGMLVTTLDTEGFLTHVGEGVKNNLLATGALDTTSDGSTLRATVGGIPRTARADRLRSGAYLGSPGELVWFTTAGAVENSIRKREADEVRDRLGLVHIEPGEDRVAIKFEASALRSQTTGRPTALDAGSNRRFKARADHSCCRRRTAWGHTVHLADLEDGNDICDGVPERISYPIATDSLGPVEVLPIGRTAIMRANSPPAEDQGFVDRLAQGRDIEFLRQSILALI